MADTTDPTPLTSRPNRFAPFPLWGSVWLGWEVSEHPGTLVSAVAQYLCYRAHGQALIDSSVQRVVGGAKALVASQLQKRAVCLTEIALRAARRPRQLDRPLLRFAQTACNTDRTAELSAKQALMILKLRQNWVRFEYNFEFCVL